MTPEMAIEFLQAFPQQVRDKVARRAINRTLSSVRTQLSRTARNAYTAHPSKVFPYVKISRSGLSGTLNIKGAPGYSLFHFRAIPKVPTKRPPAGVSALIKKGGIRKVYRKSGYDRPFIMKKKQGGFGVFVRKHGGDELQMMMGPSPIQAALAHANMDALHQTASEILKKRLMHEVEAVVQGWTKG